MGNLSTRAAGNSNEVGGLILRAYEQARTRAERSAVLDLIDKLLLLPLMGGRTSRSGGAVTRSSVGSLVARKIVLMSLVGIAQFGDEAPIPWS
jgi:hypothetical protein